MKRRQYAIIVEEDNTQRVEEINTIDEAKDILQTETYGYFWHEDDELPGECIDTNNYQLPQTDLKETLGNFLKESNGFLKVTSEMQYHPSGKLGQVQTHL